MRRVVSFALAGAVILCATPALAGQAGERLVAAATDGAGTGAAALVSPPADPEQQKPPAKPPAKPAKPRVPPEPIGARLFGLFDVERMHATQSFDAVTGSPIVFGYGGGVDLLNVWKGLFIRGSLALARASGTRAVVFDGVVIPTEFGVTVGKRAVEIGAGWRFAPARARTATYAGGGLLLVGYSERSPDAGDSENVNESFRGWFAMGGVEFRFGPRWFFGVEGHYRTVPNAIGKGGVSAAFGETELGGALGRVLIGIRFP